MEKACQSKAQEVCMKLTNDYEARLASVSVCLSTGCIYLSLVVIFIVGRSVESLL